MATKESCGGERVSTVTSDLPSLPVDCDEAVSRSAVDSSILTEEQGRAVLLVSRLTKVPVSEVLQANHLAKPEQARALEEQVNEHLVPGYRNLGKLGRGSQGIVYKAVQKCLQRVVALKVVSLQAAARSSMQRRLEREARAIATLNHPNIVSAYDYGESRGRTYLAMEYVPGASCERELGRKREPFSMQRALGIARSISLGLQYAAEKGIIHRDIKPANLLLPARPAGDPG